jgi:photosystem II stability/assembly factor-like uncharacterized protein
VGYYDSGRGNLPLIMVSNNEGKSWGFIETISGLPSDVSAWLADIQCTEKACFAAGTYRKTEDSPQSGSPLLLRSNDHGKSWSMITNITGIPTHVSHLSSISCIDNICVAAARYWLGKALFFVSHDGGNSWVTVDNTYHLPANIRGVSIFSVSCTKKVCSAGGEYIDLDGSPSVPMLLTSHDEGLSWTSVDIANLLSDFGAIGAVTCTSTSCTAVGNYWIDNENGESHQLPVLLTSIDDGNSWSLAKDILDYPANLKDGNLYILTNSNLGGNLLPTIGIYKSKKLTN